MGDVIYKVRVLEPTNLEEQIKSEVFPGTMSTALGINNARRTETDKEELRNLVNKWFYTANVGIYGIKNGEPVAIIGGIDEFLKVVVDNIDAFYNALVIGSGVYKLEADSEANQHIRSRISNNNLDEAIISNLGLKYDETDSLGKMTWKTDDYSFNKDQAALVQVPYGSLKEGKFDLNMQNMRRVRRAGSNYKITETRIWVRTPQTVKKIFEQGNYKEEDLFAQATWSNNFSGGYQFCAADKDVSNDISVRRIPLPESMKQKF